MNKPKRVGLYWYRSRENRLHLTHVTRGGDGKLYATLLKHRGWKSPRVYCVGAMSGTWSERMTTPLPTLVRK